MKYIKKIMLTAFIILLGVTIFVGCSSKGPVQLATPQAAVILNNGRLMLTTTDNPKASSYAFGWYTGTQPTNFDAYSEHTSNNRFLDVTQYVTESAVYHFYIQVVGDGERYLTSSRSATVTYDNTGTLPSPLLEISGTTLTWTGIVNATGYRLYKNNALMKSFTAVEARTYNIASQIIDSIIYNFEVEALGGTSGGITYKNSLRSNKITYTTHLNLAVPQNVRVLLDENTQAPYLTWNTVSRASGYTVKLDNNDETTYTVSTNQLVLTPVLSQAKRYSFEVKANATGVLIESAYSQVAYYDNYLPLETPSILGANRNEEDVLVMWQGVQNAQSYTLLVNGEVLVDVHSNPMVLYNTQVVISGELEKVEGGFDLQVYANAYDYYLQSETSEVFEYSGIDILTEPENINISYNVEESEVTVSWDSVAGASYYFVAVNNEVFSTTELSATIEDLLTENEISQVRIQARGNGFTEPSQYSEAVLFNYLDAQGESYLNYTNKFFYYYGYYDHYITSQEELNTYVAYLISNQIEYNDSLNRNIAYIDYALTEEQNILANGYIISLLDDVDVTLLNSSVLNISEKEEIALITGASESIFEIIWNDTNYQISSEEKDAILALEEDQKIKIKYGKISPPLPQGALDATVTAQEKINYKQYIALNSYVETHRISYGYPNNVQVPKTYEFSFEFDYNLIPTLISDQTNYTQSEDLLPFTSSTGRDENYNDFAPELSLIEIEVTTSDQLFMVVSSGAKPVFVAENSQAEQVYEAAKTVLRQIIDDNMTDYEKMLAIFDYVAYNTVYDYEVYNLAIINPNLSTLPEYRVFYLEGVILDGKAVCDGIAKTIALLANMEDIEAIKVSGHANGGFGLVGHAWNKVYLEIDGVSNWYVIDATWTDVTSQSNVEYLSRRYFLMSDADIATTHFAADSAYNPVANTEFDYYEYNEYEVGYNYYIENQTELNHLVNYLLDNNVEGVEIKLAQGFTPNISQAIIAAGEWGNVTNQAFTYANSTYCLIDFIYE